MRGFFVSSCHIIHLSNESPAKYLRGSFRFILARFSPHWLDHATTKPSIAQRVDHRAPGPRLIPLSKSVGTGRKSTREPRQHGHRPRDNRPTKTREKATRRGRYDTHSAYAARKLMAFFLSQNSFVTTSLTWVMTACHYLSGGYCDSLVFDWSLPIFTSLETIMTALYEKYRPKSLDEIKGQELAVKRLRIMQAHGGLEGNVFWITGESSTGKTTLARIIAGLVADPICTEEIDAQDLSMDLVRAWQSKCQYRALYGGFCFIVNESHGLSSKVVSRLQTVLEDVNVQKNSTWVFTTTNNGERLLFDSKMDACPFLSRAIPLKLKMDPDTVFAMSQALRAAACSEGLCNGKTEQEYVDLLLDCKGNMRLAYQKIASGEMLM
jgi:hypothetical protein